MWIAPAVVLLAVVLRAAGTDYATVGLGTVLVTYLAGLPISLSENCSRADSWSGRCDDAATASCR